MEAEPTGAAAVVPNAMVNVAVDVLKETGRASSAAIRRRLGITEGQCVALLDRMEEMGIIGGPNGEKPREIVKDLDKDWKPLDVDTAAEKKRMKQSAWSGTGWDGTRIKEIDDAAEEYNAAKVERMRLTDREVEAKTNLMALMHQHKIEHYKYRNDDDEDVSVWLEKSDETVKVKKQAKKQPEQE